MVAFALYDAERALILDLGLGEARPGAIKELIIKGETLGKINDIFAKFVGKKNEMLKLFLDSVCNRYDYDFVQYNLSHDPLDNKVVSIVLRKLSPEDYI